MAEFIELAQTQEDTKNRMLVAVQDFDKGSLQSQSKVGRALVAQNEGLRAAIKIAGDCIYDKSLENDSLRSIIGEVDESFVKNYMIEKKKNETNDDKNKRILAELQKTMNKTKQLK